MMRISTKGRYALRIMLDLARYAGEAPVSLRDIADRQHITPKYMESIMSLLLHEHLVRSVRGKSGGYTLERKPEEYTVYEILCAAEGDLAPVQCLTYTPQGCELAEQCITLPLWRGLDEIIQAYLKNIRLSDLIARANGHLSYCDGI